MANTKYTQEILTPIVRESTSIRQVLNKLNLKEEDGKSVERTKAGRFMPKKRNARAKKRARAYFDPPE